MKKNLALISIVLLLIASCTYEKSDPIPVKKNDPCDSIVSYSAIILPIITLKCAIPGCHDAGSFDGDYTTYTDLKIRADDGRLRNSVVVLKTMPKPGNTPLTEPEITKIDCWIKQGALNN